MKMRFSVLTAVVTLVASVAAAPAPSLYVVHERRDHVPRAWVKWSKLDARVKLPIRIGLTQRNLDIGHELLMNVATHDSPKYGQHYTAKEVIDIFAPSQDSVDAVRGWLEESGIESHRISQSINKQWLQFDAKTSEVESLLHTKYHLFKHVTTGKSNVACDEYHVPAQVQEHIDYITPGIKLFTIDSPPISIGNEKRSLNRGRFHKPPPIIKPLPMPVSDVVAQQSAGALDFCDAVITPDCVKALYNITAPDLAPNPANSLGIFESLGDVYDQEDLNLFFESLSPNIPQGTHPTLDAIDGATAPNPESAAGPESLLDFSLSYPIIYPQTITLFQTDDDVYQNNYTFAGFLNNFLDALDGSYCTYSAFGETGNAPGLDPPYPDPAPGGYKGNLQCGVYTPTSVISISYGGQESDLPAYYQQRQCNEFMKLGMQGVSIVLASGDSGVAGRAGDDSPDGCLGPAGTIFSPDFPATCPYLTTLGATFLPPGANVSTDSEIAVTRFPSGGGFSNIYPIPDYQAQAVASYFATADPPYPFYESINNNSFGANGGIYNRLGRGYPDFSAIGDNVVIFLEGSPALIGGTSAAAPTFASILNRINEERLAVGKTTIGFVNPTLYANPQVLHDITVGSNPGCGTNGFSVSTGWDPVTGLGTPNYPAMLDLFLSLP